MYNKSVKECSVDLCANKSFCKSYCQRHYNQMYRHGRITCLIHPSKVDRKAIVMGKIAKIPLGINAKYGYAIVDSNDAWVDKYKWGLAKIGYPMASIRQNGQQKHICLHQLLHPSPKGHHTDHKNRNKLDNRRKNLRTLTVSQNIFNSKIPRNNTSGYKGVFWFKATKTWCAYIGSRKNRVYLGYFKDIQDAIKIRKEAESKIMLDIL